MKTSEHFPLTISSEIYITHYWEHKPDLRCPITIFKKPSSEDKLSYELYIKRDYQAAAKPKPCQVKRLSRNFEKKNHYLYIFDKKDTPPMCGNKRSGANKSCTKNH